jgi:MoxR-like ATPase
MTTPTTTGDLQAVEKLKEASARLRKELSKVIIGQDAVIDQVLTSIFARGHALLVGVPGLAKTLMISTLAKSLSRASTASSSPPT